MEIKSEQNNLTSEYSSVSFQLSQQVQSDGEIKSIGTYPTPFQQENDLQKQLDDELSKYISKNEMDIINKKEKVYDLISQAFTCDMGKSISKQERNDKNLSNNNLTYGEISFKSIAEIFCYIQNKYNWLKDKGGVFIDLGSGTGKGVLTGALMHQFDTCIGVELLENLFKKSLELKEQYDRIFEEKLKEEEFRNLFNYDSPPPIQLYHGDLLEFQWSHADFVLINSTCFDYVLMQKISEKASQMKKGSFIVTLTKKLPGSDPLNIPGTYQITQDSNRDWDCLFSIKKTMSWGIATVNIHRKIMSKRDE